MGLALKELKSYLADETKSTKMEVFNSNNVEVFNSLNYFLLFYCVCMKGITICDCLSPSSSSASLSHFSGISKNSEQKNIFEPLSS